MHVGMLGTMAQMYLKDLAEKTGRGSYAGRSRARFPAAGRTATTSCPPLPRCGRASCRGGGGPAHLRDVRRGRESTQDRAAAQCGEDSGAARARMARHHDPRSAKPGHRHLNNALYARRLEWDRCAYVKDPRTGKRVARPNPRAQWEIVSVPDLRIVSDQLWDAVNARQTVIRESDGVRKGGASRIWEHRRSQNLLTGLVYCGSCGSRLAAAGSDYLACSAARGRGTCTSRASVRRGPLEELILDGLRRSLMAPELVEEFVTAFHEEVNRLRRDETAARAGKERELVEIRHKLDGLIDAWPRVIGRRDCSSGWTIWTPARRRSSAILPGGPPPSVRLHANLAQLYRRQVEHLHEALDDPTLRDEALGILRGLVERVVRYPTDDGLQVEIVGEIVKMVELGLDAKRAALPAEAACSVKVVAGAGFEPATFRL
jgi:site-specific DNA recombinase